MSLYSAGSVTIMATSFLISNLNFFPPPLFLRYLIITYPFENNEIGIFELNGQVIVKQFNLNIFTGEISLISICKDFPKINIKDSDYFNVLGKIICKLDYNF